LDVGPRIKVKNTKESSSEEEVMSSIEFEVGIKELSKHINQ